MIRTALLLLLAPLLTAQDPTPAPAPAADPVAAARARNHEAWMKRYRPEAPQLAEEKVTGWIVIVEGRILPVDGDGAIIAAPTWSDVDRLARRFHPDAPHRFVFQVGEDGDSDLFYTVAEWPDGIGRGLARAVGDATGSGWWWTPQQILLQGGRIGRKVIGVAEKDTGPWVRFDVASVDEDTWVTRKMGYASAFAGPAVVSRATAEQLELARWEIPGTMVLNKVNRCRRARARFRLKSPEVTVTVPVAV